MKTWRRLFSLLSRSERRDSFILIGMILTMALLEMVGVASIVPFIAVLAKPEIIETNQYLAWIYKEAGFTSTTDMLFLLGCLVFLAVVVSTAFKALTSYAMSRYVQFRTYSIGQRLVEGYLRQPYQWFLNRHSSDLGKSVLNETSRVVSGAILPMMNLLSDCAMAVAMLALIIAVDPLIALYLGSALIAGYALTYLLFRNRLALLGKQRVQADKRRFRILSEAFGGIKDIKVKGLEAGYLERFEATAHDLARLQVKGKLIAQLPKHVVEILAFGGMILVVLYLMRRPDGLAGALPIIALYAFAGQRLIPALHQFYAGLSNLRYAEPAVNALYEDFASLAPDPKLISVPGRLPFEQALILNRVGYRYPQASRQAVEDVELSVLARTSVGFVGATGSGKSTTVDIITGLLRPQKGKVMIDGQELTPECVRAWQRGIGYVPQHIYLSDDTIAANIAFGVPEDQIDQEAVVHAAQVANLHNFVSRELPEAYDTLVGERGVRLSGGQRQRIGIARALYHRPHTLVLDEATSALDNVTEAAVMQAVQALGHKITIIIVAHRLSTVKDCDKIYLFEGGNLIGAGLYNELAAANATFHDMVGSAT